MSFFERQEKARRNTKLLVFLFALAVIGVLLAINGVTFLIMIKYTAKTPWGPSTSFPITPFIWVTGITLIIMSVSGYLRWKKFGGSGENIALYLGGQRVSPQTNDPQEKKLMNVVEEMAIAATIPVPPVFILKHENGINAFAAGTTIGNSVIAVTQGAIDMLSRDELQGVVAHEFSHIFHGDCRLNLKLLGYLAGIATIGTIGLQIMRSLSYRSHRSRRQKGGGQVFWVGLSLFIIGSVGVVIARLIRAAVCRQREYLADASAIQFTRFPEGLAGALAKIKFYSNGSFIQSHKAEEVSHMFFSSAFRQSLMATHPPLDRRIALIDKRFLNKDFVQQRSPQPLKAPKTKPNENLSVKSIFKSLGLPQEHTIFAAATTLQELSNPLLESARNENKAPFVALSLLVSPNPQVQKEQISLLCETFHCSKEELQQYVQEAQNLPASKRLALVMLSISALKQKPESQRKLFLTAIQALIEWDGHLDLFEATLLLTYEHYLKKPEKKEYNPSETLIKKTQEVRTVLSALADYGHSDPQQASMAFKRAYKEAIGQISNKLTQNDYTGRTFIHALKQLQNLKPLEMKKLVQSCLTCIEHDGQTSPKELEMFKAICLTLEIPS
ncbi:MAG: hypothetical protein D6797_09000 [Bdellovibrio sp.]|nr:MAG: hypothetical protein D6797_09000 [Bdellovibrio sp.]